VSLPLGGKLLGEGDIRDIRASIMAEVVSKVDKNAAATPAAAAAAPTTGSAAQGDAHTAAAAATTGEAAKEEDAVGLAQQLCLETYQFRESDLDMVGASNSALPPFAIVASKVILLSALHFRLHLRYRHQLPLAWYEWIDETSFALSHSVVVAGFKFSCLISSAALLLMLSARVSPRLDLTPFSCCQMQAQLSLPHTITLAQLLCRAHQITNAGTKKPESSLPELVC
jgi:hypothetical protein